MKYDKKFRSILQKLESIDDEECKSLKAEIESLSELYQKKDERLHKIIKISDKQQMAILELHDELRVYKNNLEKKVQEEMQKRLDQEELLFEQSRLAALAEMIDAVAHQWMQPINVIHMYTDMLEFKAKENGGASVAEVEKFKKNTFLQIDHLLDTLENFRQFFRPIKEKQTFSVLESVQSVLALTQDELIKYTIEVEVNEVKDFVVSGNLNEFKHIILNLIANAKHAFIEKEIENRKIVINILGDEQKLEIIDNAGGIDPEVLKDIFEMHVSTKGEEGSGIGLYVSSQIAKKHKGEIEAQNLKDGAKFTFRLKEER
jgi:signal transduction histidine kinase